MLGLKRKEEHPKQTLGETIQQLCGGKDVYEPPLTRESYEQIVNHLKRNHASKILKGLSDETVKQALVDIVLDEHATLLANQAPLAQKQALHVVRELVGTGRVEHLLSLNSAITDLGWNGTHLSLESNDEKVLIEGSKLGLDGLYMERLIQKYARINNKEFNESAPILDGMFGHVRLNAVHESLSPDGSTISLRITRPKLALHAGNFDSFAPLEVLELLEKVVQAHANIFISGETGTGKTELQKLLLSFIPKREKVLMIEDVRETHAKVLFQDQDIYSWVTNKKTSISSLVSASLRNNPKWIIVSESRGAEAYEMMQAILSGHQIITTLHAVNARAIPTRFTNMCAIGYDIDEGMLLSDFHRYVEFGIHIERLDRGGQVIRYLAEMVAYEEEGATMIFKQDYNGWTGEFEREYGELPADFKKEMAKKSLDFTFNQGGGPSGES